MASVVTRRSVRLQQIAPLENKSTTISSALSTANQSGKRKATSNTVIGVKKRQRTPATSESTAVIVVAEHGLHPASSTMSPRMITAESLGQPSTTNGPKTPARTPRKRAAGFQKTNAPLQTPGGTRLVRLPTTADLAASESTHPSHVSRSGASTTLTTQNLLEAAKAHLLSVDPTLKQVVDKFHCKIFDPEGLAEPCEPFASLASSIMGQQVSGAAAASIKKKFVSLFPELDGTTAISPTGDDAVGKFPSPAQVISKEITTLRTAGLSQRKAEYIHGLAEKFVSGELSAQMLVDASDEEVLEKLIAVRGLGRWSVEMFACFGLKRIDIFSTGDLGVQRGMAAHRGRDVAKLKSKGGKWKYMSEAEMLEMAAPFSPFRSLFMWYMWRIEDVKIDVLES